MEFRISKFECIEYMTRYPNGFREGVRYPVILNLHGAGTIGQRVEQLRERIEQLDAAEPKNMNSEAYEEWGDLHEELEDLVDDVLDRLEEME